jgi:hypothetical protein
LINRLRQGARNIGTRVRNVFTGRRASSGGGGSTSSS